MASTVSKKRARTTTPHKRPARVGDMTTDELEALLDRKLSEWVTDPRVLRRRQEIAANAERTRAEYRRGKVKRGTVQELLADMD